MIAATIKGLNESDFINTCIKNRRNRIIEFREFNQPHENGKENRAENEMPDGTATLGPCTFIACTDSKASTGKIRKQSFQKSWVHTLNNKIRVINKLVSL